MLADIGLGGCIDSGMAPANIHVAQEQLEVRVGAVGVATLERVTKCHVRVLGLSGRNRPIGILLDTILIVVVVIVLQAIDTHTDVATLLGDDHLLGIVDHLDGVAQVTTLGQHDGRQGHHN